jgi:hypothetical protein
MATRTRRRSGQLPKKTPKVKRPKSDRELDERLRTYPQDFAWCRILGHAWTPPQTRQLVLDEHGAVKYNTSCMRCGTKRTEYLDRRTGAASMNYHHSKGYLMAGFAERAPRRADYRRHQINAMLDRKSNIKVVKSGNGQRSRRKAA